MLVGNLCQTEPEVVMHSSDPCQEDGTGED